jgi:pyruvate/2-oxoglutarate dehydrogenase complex dihydrolipoamide acyltransferase (E2) component
MGPNLVSTLSAVPGGADDVPLLVPKLGMAMTEATLLQWLAEEDAPVAEGDPLYVIETDKVETEVAAPAPGRLRRFGAEGATYQVGEAVGWLVTP